LCQVSEKKRIAAGLALVFNNLISSIKHQTTHSNLKFNRRDDTELDCPDVSDYSFLSASQRLKKPKTHNVEANTRASRDRNPCSLIEELCESQAPAFMSRAGKNQSQTQTIVRARSASTNPQNVGPPPPKQPPARAQRITKIMPLIPPQNARNPPP